jgi:hypothetical protein
MNPREECNSPGNVRVSRAGDRVPAITDFFRDPWLKKRLLRRDVAISTRDACATRSNFCRCAGDRI